MFDMEFLLTSLIVVLVPGPGVIYTISTGLFQGWRASILAALGCTLGIVPHLTASILGLSFILHMSAVVFQGIKWVGVLYLLYLAWGMWCDADELAFDGSASEDGPRQIISRAVLINLLNPKLTIFFFAFLPLFVSAEAASPAAEMLGLSILFMAMTFVVFVLYGLVAGSVRNYVVNSPKVILWLRRTFAAAFVGLGVKLALTEQ